MPNGDDELGYEDAFGKLIADTTTNKADLASHYDYNPERWRVRVDGTRVLPEYGSVAEFEDGTDEFRLKPSQGGTAQILTAEKFRYVVGYVTKPSFAFNTNRSLEGDDLVVVGYGDPDLQNISTGLLGDNADGYFLVYDTSLSSDEVKTVVYRDGTAVAGPNIAPAEKAIDIWKRYAIDLNWYNVGETSFTETYTQNGSQQKIVRQMLSNDDGKGPTTANHRARFAVKRDANSSDLTLSTGSVSVITLGDVAAILRTKTAVAEYTFSTTNEWVPMLAMRIDPDRDNVTAQLTQTSVEKWGGSGDVEIVCQAHAAQKVLDGNGDPVPDADYSAPELHNGTNSVIQTATTVDQAARESDGTTQTSITDSDGPGGFQIGYSSFRTSGSGQNTRESSVSTVQKRPINSGAVAVFWGRAENTATVTWRYDTDQDW